MAKSQLKEPPSDVKNGEITEEDVDKECSDVSIQVRSTSV